MEDGACCTTGVVAVVPRDAPTCCLTGRLDACGRCDAGSSAAGVVLGLDAAGVCCVADDSTGFLTEARRCCRRAALVDDCGVCGGDGASCDRHILGTLALAGAGLPRRFTELLQQRLPGVAVVSLEISGHARRLTAHAWDRNPPGSGGDRIPHVTDNHRGPGTPVAVPPEQIVYGLDRAATPSFDMDGQRRLLLNSAGQSQVAVEYRIAYDAAGGGVVYTAAQLSAAFVQASADAVAEGELTSVSSLPAVSAQGVAGNGFCELGETPDNSRGDCTEPVLCGTPPYVGAAEPCGGNGVCDPRDGACVCARGYTGVDCGTCDAALGYEELEVQLPGGGFAVLCSVVHVARQWDAAGGTPAGSSGPPQVPDDAGGDVPGGGGGWSWEWESLRWYVAVGAAGVSLVVAMALVWRTFGRRSRRAGAGKSEWRAGSASGAARGRRPEVVDGLAVDYSTSVGGGGERGGGEWAVVKAAPARRTVKWTQVQPVWGGAATRDDDLLFVDDMLD